MKEDMRKRLAHTYSIVAIDRETGDMGVAVQSHWFSVGTVVTWGEAGIGVVATQSFVNPEFGPKGLDLLRQGTSPKNVVKKMIKGDKGRNVRQLAVLGKKGVDAYTGKKCVPEAGHLTGEDYSVQANMMLSDRVWPEMAKRFERSKGPLAERLVAALEAAERVGGDIRGRQSAALLVVKGESTGRLWEDRAVDLRVDDDPNPLKEIKRLLKVHRAYEHMNSGDLAMENGDMKNAFLHYSSAQRMQPRNDEMIFWSAVGLANNERFDESIPLFKKAFEMNGNWLTLADRLVPLGMLRLTPRQMSQLQKINH